MALHLKSDLTEEWERNADHAQMDADHKKTAKGPKPKSCKRHKLLERICQPFYSLPLTIETLDSICQHQ